MFVVMAKKDSEGRKVTKYVTDEIGKRLIKKGKAIEVEGFQAKSLEAEKEEEDAKAHEEMPDAFAKKAELEKKSAIQKKIEEERNKGSK